jgi:membrane-bound ClpP family serine protease
MFFVAHKNQTRNVALTRSRFWASWRILMFAFAWCCLASSLCHGQEEAVTEPRLGRLVKVRLPIDDSVKREVRSALESIADNAPLAVRPEKRLVVVLEFDTQSGKTGRGSQLDECQALARVLTDRRLSGIETVAYLPAASGAADSNQGKTVLSGHAVLVALSANRLALEPGTAIGDAGVDEREIDEVMEVAYRVFPGRRGRLPPPMVASMLDASVGLARIQKTNGPITYVGLSERDEIESKENLDVNQTVAAAGKRAVLSAEQLKDFGLLGLMPESKSELERELGLANDSLNLQVSEVRDWKAIELPLPYSVDEKAERWIIRNVNRSRRDGVNLVIVTIDESFGDPNGCLAVARQLAELSGDDVQTVAFVRGKARGAVGLVALACDHLIMAPDAVLGGFEEEAGDEFLSKEELEQLQPAVKRLAEVAEKDWSIMMAMLDPGLVVTRYRDTKQSGKIRLMTDEEAMSLGDKLSDWQPQDVLSVSSGLKAATAERFGLTRLVAQDMGQVQTFYQLDAAPEIVQLTSTERMVDRIASFFRNPIIGLFLLLGAFFFISNEMSAPGLGVPGFLGTLCVVLYFWSHWFGGATEVFEILMFVLGLIFIGLEIFVIPGIGIFGIGGTLLVLTSIVLASQDFVVPINGKQWAQVPYSMMPLIGAGLGFVGAVFFLQTAIEKSPLLRRFVLDTSENDEAGFEEKDKEAVADWSHLMGMSGQAITRLSPSGKARIDGGVYDVISTGQMVDKGVAIEVVEAVANRVVVQPKGA